MIQGIDNYPKNDADAFNIWFHQNMHAMSLSEIHLRNFIEMDALEQDETVQN